MAPQEQERSSLKRARLSTGEHDDYKKPRRSARLSQADNEPHVKQWPLPSPVTHIESRITRDSKTTTPSPEPNVPGQHATPDATPNSKHARIASLSSPYENTQVFSQFVAPAPITYEVDDEDAEGVWGYLIPITDNSEALVLKKRAACPVPVSATGVATGRQKVSKKHWVKAEEGFEQQRAIRNMPSGGYLLGRHPECDRIINDPTVSNRHCLLFSENKDGGATAVLEDLSGNGTFVRDAIVGRNKRRDLEDGDEISILDKARYLFRYPRSRDTDGFKQHYTILQKLGKGHFATVYMAMDQASGMKYAVKKFEKRSGPGERSKMEGLQQEIGVLMGVSHPSMLCLKDTYDEKDAVYLVLELAPEGELFNWIVMKHKLSESETRKIFIQLFQGVKYLHDRNIVHRDIKPENILVMDKQLNVKLADFGLAKIIGEESFTTTLCGTPSYVAPEILEQSNHRRYTRAVDVWSLGVVLYICLCGFPPFSDELYSAENPYTLSQQIKAGRFDYPSPYWDSVGDPALELIDRMLTVDSEKRITIDECLEHPWIINGSKTVSLTDSTDGLTGAFEGLDFSKRKPVRERTLLSAINDIQIERVIPVEPNGREVKVFNKNLRPASQATQASQKTGNGTGDWHSEPKGKPEETVEPTPDAARNPQEFMEMGGRGDEVLYDESTVGGESKYPEQKMKSSTTGTTGTKPA